MTLDQVQNWIRFCDCVLNDVTYKTNHYGMPLSLFIEFNKNRQNLLLAQVLLVDKSLNSYVWMFKQIMLATEHQPGAILTDADSAIDSAVQQVFSKSYSIHCTYHIIQNLYKT